MQKTKMKSTATMALIYRIYSSPPSPSEANGNYITVVLCFFSANPAFENKKTNTCKIKKHPRLSQPYWFYFELQLQRWPLSNKATTPTPPFPCCAVLPSCDASASRNSVACPLGSTILDAKQRRRGTFFSLKRIPPKNGSNWIRWLWNVGWFDCLMVFVPEGRLLVA